MYIQCTKKLLDKLGQPYTELADPPEQQYCWHANFFDYKGLLFVVMINDYSDDEFFFQLDSFKNFNLEFEQGFQRDMKDAGIPSDDISSYMKEAGPILFGPTGDRDKIAKLNGFTRRFKSFTIDTLAFLHEMDERAEEEGLPLNFGESAEDFPTFDERPRLAPKRIQKEKQKTKQKTAQKPTNPLMITLDVKLKLLGRKNVSRSFLVPINTNFATLNEILQIGFGWTNTHLHEFYFSTHGFSVGTIEEPCTGGFRLLGNPAMHDEHTMMLSDLLPTIQHFTYLYDFGDGWEHTIKVGDIGYVDGDHPLVICTKGRGLTPPEDCGGKHGFAELLDILKDPIHEDYDVVKHWAVYDFDGGFDRARTNERLAALDFPLVSSDHW